MRKQGFTLAEVMISLFILTSAVYVLSNLQFRSSRRVLKSSDEIERVFPVKKTLYNLFFKPPQKDKPVKLQLEEPEVTITAHKQEIDKKKSSLKNFADKVDIIWAKGEWQRGTRTEEVKIISFVPKPKKKKKK